MTKMKIRLVSVVCIALLFVICLNVNNKNKILKQIENDAMTNEFSDTIDSYYWDEKNSLELEVYSAEPTMSSLKMIALYNYLNEKNKDISLLNEEENIFRYEIEESLYRKKNCIDTKKLNSDASISDFYHAVYVADKIEDTELLEEIKRLYTNFESTETSKTDMIYREIIGCYLGNGANAKQLDNVVQNVSSAASAERISIDFESINNLKACIQYLIITDNYACVDEAKKIYKMYTESDNERYIIFDMDVVFEDYLWILKLLKEYTAIDTSSDLFHDVFEEGMNMHKGVVYQMTTPLNFACFVTALAYQNRPISDNLYRNLKIMFEQIEAEVVEGDYMAMYYLQYVADLLNIEYKLPTKQVDEITNDYYSLLIYDKQITEKEYATEEGGVVEILSCADVCKPSENITEQIQDIDILSYKDMNEYGMVLNLYVCVIMKYDLITDQVSEEIKNYIQSNMGMFGYEVDGAYDFRTSIYYTNVMYMLDGGKDIGLR